MAAPELAFARFAAQPRRPALECARRSPAPVVQTATSCILTPFAFPSLAPSRIGRAPQLVLLQLAATALPGRRDGARHPRTPVRRSLFPRRDRMLFHSLLLLSLRRAARRDRRVGVRRSPCDFTRYGLDPGRRVAIPGAASPRASGQSRMPTRCARALRHQQAVHAPRRGPAGPQERAAGDRGLCAADGAAKPTARSSSLAATRAGASRRSMRSSGIAPRPAACTSSGTWRTRRCRRRIARRGPSSSRRSTRALVPGPGGHGVRHAGDREQHDRTRRGRRRRGPPVARAPRRLWPRRCAPLLADEALRNRLIAAELAAPPNSPGHARPHAPPPVYRDVLGMNRRHRHRRLARPARPPRGRVRRPPHGTA